MTVASLSVPLVPSGTEFSDRVKQLDLTLRKSVPVGKVRLEPGISLFNALNNHAAYAVRSMNYLTSSYLQPSTVLQPRLLVDWRCGERYVAFRRGRPWSAPLGRSKLRPYVPRCLAVRRMAMKRSLVIFALVVSASLVAAAVDPPRQVEWLYYGGDQGGMKYSPLTDINADNLSHLQIAWHWKLLGNADAGRRHRAWLLRARR